MALHEKVFKYKFRATYNLKRNVIPGLPYSIEFDARDWDDAFYQAKGNLFKSIDDGLVSIELIGEYAATIEYEYRTKKPKTL